MTQLYPLVGTVFRDTYLLDFLDLPEVHSEQELQQGLVGNLRKFLQELGADFTFVGDAVAATIAAGERGVPGRVYNVGGGSRVSMNQVLQIIEQVAGHRLAVVREPAQKGDMRDTYADSSLARQDLGFAPAVALEEGIQAEYRWLSSSPALV